MSRAWLPDLLLGVVAFAAATWLNDAYRSRTTIPNYVAIRWGAYTLYSIGSAASGFALLGVFQRYLDRPSRMGRYLADTALWVYLVHQPLVLVGLAWIVPYRWPWGIQTAVVSALAVAVALVLYEAMVRPTALVRLLGPAGPRSAPPWRLPRRPEALPRGWHSGPPAVTLDEGLAHASDDPRGSRNEPSNRSRRVGGWSHAFPTPDR